MNTRFSRNTPHYSFAPENTINYSNGGAQTISNGLNDIKSILKEIKEEIKEEIKALQSSLINKVDTLQITVKSAKEDIINSLPKKSTPSSPGNSAHSDKLIPPRKLEKGTGIYRRRNERKNK